MKNNYISVVIPVYNDPEGLRTTLESLVAQDYPKEGYEIIVVDNNSSDNTTGTVDKFMRDYPGLVRLLHEREIQSSYAARNKGIENARGDIICFIDSDMWVDKDFLSKIGEKFRNRKVHYLGYRVELVNEKLNSIARCHAHTGFDMENFVNRKHFAGTGALTVRKTLFEEAGVFDERLISGGDMEFGNRIYEMGLNLDYSGDIRVFHPAPSRLMPIAKKYFRYGRGHGQLVRYYPGRFKRFDFRLYNIRLYLPPNPLKIKDEYICWTDISRRDKLILYVFLYMVKCSFFSGFFSEKLFRRQTP